MDIYPLTTTQKDEAMTTTLKQEVQDLLQEIGSGKMISTTYDTAWVARLVSLDEEIGREALEWLREQQLPDGSWGARKPLYAHDRLICTLAAMAVLARWGNQKDKKRLDRALLSIDIFSKSLLADPVGETVGFEMIVPALLEEVKVLGVLQRQTDGELLNLIFPGRYTKTEIKSHKGYLRGQNGYLDRLVQGRNFKIQALPKGKISRHVTHAFSAEMVGMDSVHLLDIENLQEENGSVGHSPAATAHFALYVRPNDPAAMAYLKQVVRANRTEGGVADVAPFDVFERVWTLWNISLIDDLHDDFATLCQDHLDFLEQAWHPGAGLGLSAGFTPKDSDHTCLAFDVLTRFGRILDVEALLSYEEDAYFRCYALEANPSISVNIHMLGALRNTGLEVNHPTIQKIISFLQRTMFIRSFWFDKWHSSPYYPTSHAIIVARGYAEELVQPAIDWLIDTQNADGSWGYYLPTAEETAYALQALILWQQSGKKIPVQVIKKGLAWLNNHMDPPYPPLWIGKCLYTPTLVVRSAILSALALGNRSDLS